MSGAGNYAEMGRALGELTQMKNLAYGDSFEKSGELLKLLYPKGIHPEQYRDALAIVRVIDKLFRIATRKDAFGESPWKDIAGYGILGAVSDERAVEADEACVERRDHFETLPAKPWEPEVGEKVIIINGVPDEYRFTYGTVVQIDDHPQYPYDVSFGEGRFGSFQRDQLAPADQP